MPEGEGDVEPPKVENQAVTTVEPECMKYSRPEERETWCESQFDNVQETDAFDNCINNYCNTCCGKFYDMIT